MGGSDVDENLERKHINNFSPSKYLLLQNIDLAIQVSQNYKCGKPLKNYDHAVSILWFLRDFKVRIFVKMYFFGVFMHCNWGKFASKMRNFAFCPTVLRL